MFKKKSDEQRISDQFESAYSAHRDALFRHCYFRVNQNREVALDLTQEIFTRTWIYLADGRTVENMRAFLYTTAEHAIIDFVRKRKATSLDALLDEGIQLGNHGDTTMNNTTDVALLSRHLNELEMEEKTIFLLRYFDGLKPREIAQVMGLSQNVVSVRIHRAKTKIQNSLKAKIDI